MRSTPVCNSTCGRWLDDGALIEPREAEAIHRAASGGASSPLALGFVSIAVALLALGCSNATNPDIPEYDGPLSDVGSAPGPESTPIPESECEQDAGVYCIYGDQFYSANGCGVRLAYPRHCPREFNCVEGTEVNSRGVPFAIGCQHISGVEGSVSVCSECGECRLTGERIDCCVELPGFIPIPPNADICQTLPSSGPQWQMTETGARADCDPYQGCVPGACNIAAGSAPGFCEAPLECTQVEDHCNPRNPSSPPLSICCSDTQCEYRLRGQTVSCDGLDCEDAADSAVAICLRG